MVAIPQRGGSAPVVHFNLVDASKCVIPQKPPSCYTHIIDEISADNFINRTLAPGKAYELYFSNEANIPDDSKSITARFLFEHLPFLVKVKTGEANTTVSLNQFMPSTIDVKVGQNVTWYNPSQVPEAQYRNIRFGLWIYGRHICSILHIWFFEVSPLSGLAPIVSPF